MPAWQLILLALFAFTFTPAFTRFARRAVPYRLHLAYDPITRRSAVWVERIEVEN